MLSFRYLLEYIGKYYNVSEQDSNDFYLILVIVVLPVPQSLPGREWPWANILGECFPSHTFMPRAFAHALPSVRHALP